MRRLSLTVHEAARALTPRPEISAATPTAQELAEMEDHEPHRRMSAMGLVTLALSSSHRRVELRNYDTRICHTDLVLFGVALVSILLVVAQESYRYRFIFDSVYTSPGGHEADIVLMFDVLLLAVNVVGAGCMCALYNQRCGKRMHEFGFNTKAAGAAPLKYTRAGGGEKPEGRGKQGRGGEGRGIRGHAPPQQCRARRGSAPFYRAPSPPSPTLAWRPRGNAPPPHHPAALIGTGLGPSS